MSDEPISDQSCNCNLKPEAHRQMEQSDYELRAGCGHYGHRSIWLRGNGGCGESGRKVHHHDHTGPRQVRLLIANEMLTAISVMLPKADGVTAARYLLGGML